MSDGTGVWMYAVAPAGFGDDPLRDLTGVDGEQPHVVEAAGLAAVVGAVSLAEFGEEALHRNLENLTWLEKVARAHDAVIAAVAKTAAVVPLRLATMYLSDERVSAMLAERSEEFRKALRLIEGRSEWGVRAHLRRTEESRAGSGSQERGARSAGPLPRGAGAAYLQRRRSQLTARKEAEKAAAEAAEKVHNQLCRYAVGARRQPPPSQQLTGTTEPVLLNGTYLVDNARAQEFVAAVEAMDYETGPLRLVLTGPWPPYSFTAAAQGQ